MFEPQDHPNVFPYPGAPPTPPYDNAGWTLAFQMGVQFDRILEPFTGPFEKVTDWNVKLPAGRVAAASGAAVRRQPPVNDAFIAVNRLLRGERDGVRRRRHFFVAAGPTTAARCTDRGGARRRRSRPPRRRVTADARTPRARRASASGTSTAARWTSGWTRWILEQFEFPFERVFAPQLDAGNLNAKYDVLIFVERRRFRRRRRAARGGRGGGAAPADIEVPAEYPIAARPRDCRTDDAAAAAVRRRRRHDRRDRRLGDESGAHFVAADRESSGRERRAAAAREVLRAGLGARRAESTSSQPLAARHDASARTSSSTTARCSSSGRTRRQAGVTRDRVVRFADAAAQRLGVGTAVSGRRRRRGRSDARQGTRAALRAGDPAARAAARHVQAAVQQPVSERGA